MTGDVEYLVKSNAHSGVMFKFGDGKALHSTLLGVAKLRFDSPGGIRPFTFKSVAYVLCFATCLAILGLNLPIY